MPDQTALSALQKLVEEANREPGVHAWISESHGGLVYLATKVLIRESGSVEAWERS